MWNQLSPTIIQRGGAISKFKKGMYKRLSYIYYLLFSQHFNIKYLYVNISICYDLYIKLIDSSC